MLWAGRRIVHLGLFQAGLYHAEPFPGKRRGVEKAIYSRESKAFTAALRAAREGAGLTQVELAKKLRITQSYLSKVERGERRLDLMQLREFCSAMGIPLGQFVADFESRISKRTV